MKKYLLLSVVALGLAACSSDCVEENVQDITAPEATRSMVMLRDGVLTCSTRGIECQYVKALKEDTDLSKINRQHYHCTVPGCEYYYGYFLENTPACYHVNFEHQGGYAEFQ